MKNKPWLIVPLSGLPLFLAILGFLWYNDYTNTKKRTHSKFSIGDCIKYTYNSEFEESVFYYKILKVGNEQYLARVRSPTLKEVYLYDQMAVYKIRLNQYDAVDKELCEL